MNRPVLLFVLTVTVFCSSGYALWPQPRQLSTGTTPLILSSDFSIVLSIAKPPQDLVDAVNRTMTFLHNDRLERLIVGRSAADRPLLASALSLNSLDVALGEGATIRSVMQETLRPLEERQEGYSLTVPADSGRARLEANTTLGLVRGLTTFSQMWYFEEGEGRVYMVNAPVEVVDEPAFAYRGLMLDTCRNFFPVDDIKRFLDTMSWVKLNIFHWHVVDSQSFPLQVPGFEEIALKGAYSASSVYSPDDIQDLVTYAGERGIDVVVKIDTPGHTAIISESHPEHVACPQSTPWATFAEEPPAGQLRLTPPTVNFTAGLLSKIAKMFPSPLFSAGGDEVNVPCYAQDPDMQQYINASGLTLNETLQTFVSAMQSVLIAEGKTPLLSEEMVLESNLTVSNETIVLVWKSSNDIPPVVEKGLRVIFAASDYMFLDCGAGEWIGADPTGWCDPFKTWQKTYSVDPFANLTTKQTSRIVGGQHLLWTEQSSPANMDSITWPRAAAGAEVFWTGSRRGNVSVALPRLHDVAFRMVQRGVRAIPLQPEWCALRPGVCDLTA
ncbi:N-acetylhexosaminidase [Amylostereum chailletii]|nr:N-acetylhexosaminidase [Amylostereum chailletii]